MRLQIEENIELVERGRLEVPADADLMTFLVSDGRLASKPKASGQLQLGTLFEKYRESLPRDSHAPESLRISKIHMGHVARILGEGTRLVSITAGDRRVYDAIVVQLIAAFYPPCLKEVTTVDAIANDVPFRARGVRLVEPGWTELFPRKSAEPGAEDEQSLPNFAPRESGPHEPFIKPGQTTPPKHFSENTLLGAMDTAGKLVEEGELREALREKGLGVSQLQLAAVNNAY